MERQQALWANLGLQPGVHIGILREDGVLVSHWPLSNTKVTPQLLSAKPLADAIANNATNGFYREAGKTWILNREGVYQRMRAYPAYTYLSIANNFFLHLWWRTIQVPIYTFVILYLLAFTLYS